MTLKEFLLEEEWTIYQVCGQRRQFFGDTVFGPMWKNIPSDIEVSNELFIGTSKEVNEYLQQNAENKVSKCDDVLL